MDNSAKTPTYFETIVLTLTESLNDPDHVWISIHDLIEAYNVISRKIRTLASALTSTDQVPSFLAIFEVKSTQITECLTRDIRCMLLDTQRSYGNTSSYSQEPDENDVEVAIDYSVLCLNALRFVSHIFTFRAIYSNFTGTFDCKIIVSAALIRLTEDQLTSILDDVLSLCTIENPSTYNGTKLSEMALWILKTQELPSPILIHQKSRILMAFKNSISGNIGSIDAFKVKVNYRPFNLYTKVFQAVHRILEKFPSFSIWLIELLPMILEHLNGIAPDSRVHAAFALCGFASAKIALGLADEFPQEYAIQTVMAYLDKEAIQPRTIETESRTITLLVTALTNGSYSPAFSLSIVSCFIVLLEDAALTYGRSIRLITRVLAPCERHKSGIVRLMHTEIWIMLIWSYSLLPTDTEDQSRKMGKTPRENAYTFLCEALSDRSRLAFIHILLGTNRSRSDVRRAIDLIGKIIDGDDACNHKGVKLLCHLLSTIGSSFVGNAQPHPKFPFALELVNGLYLLRPPAEIKIPETNVDMKQLLPLTEKEVLQEWQKLSSIWVRAVQHSLDCDRELSVSSTV